MTAIDGIATVIGRLPYQLNTIVDSGAAIWIKYHNFPDPRTILRDAWLAAELH